MKTIHPQTNTEISQEDFVVYWLRENKEITRNFCLRNYISRLGAIICNLQKKGWRFETGHRSGDYIYKVIKDPAIKDTLW